MLTTKYNKYKDYKVKKKKVKTSSNTDLKDKVNKLRNNPTAHECVIIGYLEVLKMKYIFQKLFKNNSIPMIVDFYLYEKNIILEIDGAYRMQISVVMCNKKKLDKIKAMMIVANAQKQTQKNFNRKEIRVYFCSKCNAYHTTSKK